jgi:integrase
VSLIGRCSSLTARAATNGWCRTFFDDCAMHGWNADMSPNVRLVPGDGPGFVTGLPRFISEDVMAQLEDPANIARFTDGPARNLFLIARETGKRIGEITTLPRDPVVVDSTGAPCLTYCDHKSSREGIVPISAIAADAIGDQQHIVAQQHPTSPWLFPRPARNADGSRHYSTQLFQIRLTEWMRRCDMRDSSGNPITVTSHQFRHTMATRMQPPAVASGASFTEVREARGSRACDGRRVA